MTGMSGVVAELSSKLVEFVRDLLPLAHKVAVRANAPDPFSKPFLEQRRLAGSATGVEMARCGHDQSTSPMVPASSWNRKP